MISIDEINSEISKLENQPTSYSTVERLSWLYVVKDHLTEHPALPTATTEIPKGESEYYCACAGKTINEIMAVMNELMETLNVIQPRLYAAVMNKLT